MFTTEKFIDTVQGAKKQAVSVMFKDLQVANTLTSIIDAQTKYTKDFMGTLTESSKVLGAEAIKTATTMPKFDITKWFNSSK